MAGFALMNLHSEVYAVFSHDKLAQPVLYIIRDSEFRSHSSNALFYNPHQNVIVCHEQRKNLVNYTLWSSERLLCISPNSQIF